jgi:NAD/NADP transhydrogenase alpha subunit
VVGGFVVTDRMLEMFKAKPGDRAAARANGPQAAKAEDAAVAPATPSEPGGGAA